MDATQTQKSFDVVHVVNVHLANSEYGGDIMDKVAKEYLLRYSHFDKQDLGEALIVNVYEHGGWHLGYAMVEGEFEIVYSANDRAKWAPAQEAFKQAAYKAKWQAICGDVRRND